jgi:hypothetical protein
MGRPASWGVGYVYFLGNREMGMVKIGYSADSPENRLKALQTGSPVLLERMGIVRGDKSLEYWLHSKFKKDRSHGEWFRLSASIDEWIGRHCKPWEADGSAAVPPPCEPFVIPPPEPPKPPKAPEPPKPVSADPFEGLSPQARAARIARYKRREEEFWFGRRMEQELLAQHELRRSMLDAARKEMP